jgi:ketosteroid isomerase-like protein
VSTEQVEDWLQGYLRAWASNDPEDIGSLFSEDGKYFTAPFREPWSGREAIVREWIDRKDEPGQYHFRYEVLAECDGMAFVRGWTSYPRDGEDYSNLWVIRLAEDGQASEFTEWWMEEKPST